MENDENVNHNFNLKNLKVNDWFLGCGKCNYQLPPKTGAVNECPKCLKKFSIYTVRESDIV